MPSGGRTEKVDKVVDNLKMVEIERKFFEENNHTMTDRPTIDKADKLNSNPYFKYVQLLLMLIVSIIGTSLLRAEDRLSEDIDENERRIEQVEKAVTELEKAAVVTVESLKYIREGIDDIKSDIKELKERK